MSVIFTVCIPLFNKEKTICRTLSSIENQSFEHFNVLILNDGSNDRSLNAVNDFLESTTEVFKLRIRVIDQANRGDSIARLRLIKYAVGNYLAFIDADDEWYSNHLSDLYDLIGKVPGLAIYSTAFDLKRGKLVKSHKLNKIKSGKNRIDLFESMAKTSGVINSSVVCLDRLKATRIMKKNMDVFSGNLSQSCGDVVLWSLMANSAGLGFSSSKTAIINLDNAKASITSNVSGINYSYMKIRNSSKSWTNKNHVMRWLNIFLAKNIAGIRINNKSLVLMREATKKDPTIRFKVRFIAFACAFVPTKVFKRKRVV